VAPGYVLKPSDVILRAAVTVGSMLGGLGAWVAVASAAEGFQIHGGCAGGGMAGLIMLSVALLGVGWLGLIALTMLAGIAFIWFKYNLGAALLLAANVAVVVTIGLLGPGLPGRAGEVTMILVLAVPPVLVIGALFWAWVARTPRLGDRIIAVVVVMVVLSPVAVLFGAGLSRDVVMASTATEPEQVVITTCAPATG
jgi:hypothetical protein